MNMSSIDGKFGSIIAVLITALLGMITAWWTAMNDHDKGIPTALNSLKNEISTQHQEVIARFDKLETRVSNLESSKTIWTGTDMLRWSVHLKDSNPSLKVPEPEIRQ